MRVRIDQSGRIVFPKPLRRRLGLAAGAELEVVEQPDGVLLRSAPEKPSMIQVDGLWVHQGAAESGASWERVLDDVREERLQEILRF
jgi:AbrB family looped-hinge helix DNA binding protein